ncbi:General stress protein A [Candidatus Profftia lariciata]|uniref:glycosyltransferase n=1 Tax=Candidatus Profftia lariciata TaxID=1987921 RepID=UPI001D01141C|nr:glycosyltransferase [Candidatus Profftia lariciata]UDG81348.1 General stress protein A [Candidatus Profftia lariciata]
MNYQYFKKQNFITANIKFITKNYKNNNILHIAYGIDKNFLFGCSISISSIAMYNKEHNIIYHVFIDNLTANEKNNFLILSKKFNINITIHLVKCQKIKVFPTTKNWSYAMYLRFIIGDYFIDHSPRVLYLDADIICQGDISELFSIELERYVLSAVLEQNKQWWTIMAENLSCQPLVHGYFNSGFLLINTDAWHKEDVTQQAVSMLENVSFINSLVCMDQDILNLILLKKVKYIDSKYNTQINLNYKLKDHFYNPIKKNTVFVHYIGPTKPWHSWARYNISNPFIHAKNQSPWSAAKLIDPSNAHQYKYCARHNFHQGNSLNGIKYYLNYLLLIVKGLLLNN